jgi:hypothetical protein
VAASIIVPQEPATCVGAPDRIVVVVLQLPLPAQAAPAPAATLLTRLPAALAGALMTTLATPLPAARPAGTVQVSVLPDSALQLAPVGVTVTAPMPDAGSVSVRVIGALVAALPLLFALRVQVMVSPT